VFPAEWNKYGNRAGPMRNTLIVAEADYIIGFPSKTGRGTQDTLKKAWQAKKRLYIHDID